MSLGGKEEEEEEEEEERPFTLTREDPSSFLPPLAYLPIGHFINLSI